MNKLKVGIIGCGRISVIYAQAFCSMSSWVDVVVAYDKELTRAETFATQFEGCQAVDSIEAFLACTPQIAHILTPHFLHKQQSIECMNAGMHVLTEKPIALSLMDADAMIATMRQTGRKLGVIFQNRYIDGIVEAKKLLKSGELGQVTGAWSTLNWWRPPSYYECDWKGSWDKEGGGVVIDQAIHSIDLVRYLVGKPVTSVKGHIDRRVLTNIEVEDVADAVIVFDNGVKYSFYACNYYTANSDIRIELSCENGTILLVGTTVTITVNGVKRVIEPAQDEAGGESYWGNYHVCQLRDFYCCINNDIAVPEPHDAKETLAIVLGIYQSSRDGCHVLLN